jgi:acetoin utilization protein AcuC
LLVVDTRVDEAIAVASAPLFGVPSPAPGNPWTTVRLWAGLWARMLGQPIPARLPAPAQHILAQLTCDLVDNEDRDPAWLDRLVDPVNAGPIRPRIHALIDAALPP